jgi:phage head maturation protease
VSEVCARTTGVGFLSRLRLARDVAVEQAGPSFDITSEDIDPAVFGLESWSTQTTPAGRVTRRTARQVGAVKRGRDLICGTLGGLPIDLIGPDQTQAVSSLFDQPERDVPRSVTMVKTFEDMYYAGRAWWEILELGWHGYPVWVRRLDVDSVDHNTDTGRVHYKGREITPDKLIRFDSPNDPLLEAGARAIRVALGLSVAAATAAVGVPPVDYFVPADDSDPLEDAEIAELLADWRTARQAGRTAYVPAALEYQTAGWNPEQMQLSAQQGDAVLELSRHIGLDPEDLGVSVTSRTYANAETRRRDLLDFTLSAYLIAVSDRLAMGDVTPRGYYARFNLDAFLRSDTLQRYQAYEVGLRVGALTRPEIRVLEDRPPLEDTPDTDDQETETVDNVTALPPAAARVAGMTFEADGPTFDAAPALRLDAPGAQAFEVDPETRTIRGLLVPYGVPARSQGQWWSFSAGTLTYASPDRVKLWIQHDPNRAVGYALELTEQADGPAGPGLYGAFKVARGAAGDEALSMAEDRVWDGFSIGIGEGGRFKTKGTGAAAVHHAQAAPLMETSLTPVPSFDDARVHAVAASAAPITERGSTMKCTKCGHQHAEGVVECQADHLAAFAASQATLTYTADPGPADFSPITDAIRDGFQAISPRETVHNQVESIQEAPAYRFDGVRGEHDFSADLIAFGRDRDSDAGARVMSFLTEQFSPTFDVDTGNTTELNPARTRADMYVDERTFRTPVYDALYAGSITDMTPFIVPKFNTASGLVADHVEGVEPTPGAMDVTSQTVTPSAVSGKVEITREVWDQGGNPQASGLIWNKMVYNYYQALETAAAAVLTAAAGSITDIALTTNAEDDVLVNELTAALAGLQFAAGGELISMALTHQNLYARLAAAVDSTGRKLLPVYGPTNADGTTRSRFNSLDVAGYEFLPARSLGAASANTSNSWLIDPSSVHLWNSPPQRLEFQYRVAYVDLAIWGYKAAAVTDTAGVRQITYDPTT